MAEPLEARWLQWVKAGADGDAFVLSGRSLAALCRVVAAGRKRREAYTCRDAAERVRDQRGADAAHSMLMAALLEEDAAYTALDALDKKEEPR